LQVIRPAKVTPESISAPKPIEIPMEMVGALSSILENHENFATQENSSETSNQIYTDHLTGKSEKLPNKKPSSDILDTIPSFDDIFDIDEDSEKMKLDNIPCISVQSPPPTTITSTDVDIQTPIDEFANDKIDNFFNLVASSPCSISESESGYESNSPLQMDGTIDDVQLEDYSDLFPDFFGLE